MSMPTLTEYQDAIQNPRSCFYHPELQQSTPEPDKIGLPRPLAGSFAVVFPVFCGSKKWAVRCFSTCHQDQEFRYEKINEHLKRSQLPYTVGFDFLKQGIRVKGKWYPILKMEWVEGDTLLKYVEKNLSNPKAIQALAEKFFQLVCDLKKCNIAHGDLQHGNILVANGYFRLVDYDGMFVPGLEGMQSNEVGHPNYQHPSRTSRDFGPYLDNFSAWCIYVSLVALGADPELWHRINAGDEHICFRRKDIDDPGSSQVFKALEKASDSTVQSLVTRFRSVACCPDVSLIPPLDSGPQPTTTAVKPAKEVKITHGSSWVLDHLPPRTIERPIPSLPERAVAKVYFIFVVFFFGLSLTQGGHMPLAIAAGVVAVFPFLLLAFHFRFKGLPVMSEKTKFSSDLANLQRDIKKIEGFISNLKEDRNKLQQGRDKKVNEMALKQRDATQREQNEIAKIEKDLRDKLSNISSERQQLHQSETSELTKALEDLQAQFLRDKLSRHELTSSSIMGIGPEMTKRLWANGIRTAADIAKVEITQRGYGLHVSEVAYIEVPGKGKVHVEGIGPKKAYSLLSWKQGIEQRYKTSIPRSLPFAQENAIKSKYLVRHNTLNADEADAKSRAANARESVRLNFQKEKEALKTQLSDTQTFFAKQLDEVNEKIAKETKQLSNKHWSHSIMSRDLQPYLKIRFSNYVKRAMFS